MFVMWKIITFITSTILYITTTCNHFNFISLAVFERKWKIKTKTEVIFTYSDTGFFYIGTEMKLKFCSALLKFLLNNFASPPV